MKMIRNCKKGFTLAEILITLSIIGIVAALTIPALMASVDERVYTTQKKALIARLSNAISQFDTVGGYGTTADDSTEAFILALSKVYKMNSICNTSNLSACDVPETVTGMDGNEITLIDGGTPKNLSDLNDTFKTAANITDNEVVYYQDTKPAAFTTINGESVLVYYNPKCATASTVAQHIQQTTCANMIFDLNGANEPNQVGKDIGFVTIISNETPKVGGPIPDKVDLADNKAYKDAIAACKTNDNTTRLPNIDEAGSMFVNKFMLGTLADKYWSGSVVSSKINDDGENEGQAWYQSNTDGMQNHEIRTATLPVRCVKK